MRLTYRYAVAGVSILLLICTYEVYIYSGKASYMFRKLSYSRVQTHNVEAFDSNRTNVHKFTLLPSKYRNSSRGHSSSKHWQSVKISAEEYRKNPKLKTGNPLIDNYGQNDLHHTGEMGRGVTFVGKEKLRATQSIQKYNLNTIASDLIPLNRLVPDSRPPGCKERTYEHDLPTASVILPFYDEWPSVLIRTLYSIVNRTPRHLLQEIVMVDDASQMSEIKKPLDDYIEANFPKGIIKVIRNKERKGLIKSRLQGWRASTGQVVVFFDSHMEVNYDWLQPLLTEIKINRKTVSMGVLDYINSETLEYRFNEGYMTRYGFDWRLVFFETFFREDQLGKTEADTRPGTVMVGAAYAIDTNYFAEIGTYDEGMKVWGGENLEMAWRVWMCGGRLVHLPCSHLGHIARAQPYSFPGGRRQIEVYNYKRAVEVWMEPEQKELIYDYFPEMKSLDVGDLSPRLALKEKLHCKNFTWFIETIWPELALLYKDVLAWGSARNLEQQKCLDNHQYLFQAPENVFLEACHYQVATQGFSWTKNHLIKTSLQCLVAKQQFDGARPMLEDCIIGPRDTWKHTKNGHITHEKSGLCLDADAGGPIMRTCQSGKASQQWVFTKYNM
ncbi:hypothetical protein FSP39_003790 [Pinctada imbricata]|uniref:Polypeptide N-acetylgalactosaminyltransferase n=1 Tax=Pinctada imbricata TaxID=66713 RepID=A0AA88Y2I8_PINIB|nr:hypothetical protein FSP39_003790 [Pinctada imbricata]